MTCIAYPGYQISNDVIVDKIHDEKEIEENKSECFESDPGLSHNEAFQC